MNVLKSEAPGSTPRTLSIVIPMGEYAECRDGSAPRTVKVTAAGRSAIARVEIVRNNAVVHTEEPGDWKTEFEWTDTEPLKQIAYDPSRHIRRPFVYYYVRVTCRSGAKAWSSPIWTLDAS